MLVNIDKTDFNTGILYNRTVPIAKINTFNEELNISNVDHFEQSLLELYKSSLSEKFISHSDLRNYYVHDTIKNVVDVGIINTTFNELNYLETSEDDGGLRLSQGSFQKIDNGKSAFIERRALIISPLKKAVLGSVITFNFSNTFLLEETLSNDMESLVANFDTAQDYIIYENGLFTNTAVDIPYNEDGYKMLTFTATFSDGTSRTTQALIYSKVALPPPPDRVEDGDIDALVPFIGIGETTPILAHLDYRIFYSNPQGIMRKPFIIIDGFDPGDKRKITDADFIGDPEHHKSIYEYNVYESANGDDVEIIPILNTLGYDVVVVNHPTYNRGSVEIDGGADFIQRNAMAHIELYKHLNARLASINSDEQLVIVGPSMGGQISRYALAYMENPVNNQPPHNTRLWISLDSPHLGANIPLGLQTLIRQAMPDSAEAQDFNDNQLGSPAAKQQLIEQLDGWNVGQIHQQTLNARTVAQGFSENRGHQFFVQYYNDLFNEGRQGSNGYPQDSRNIALVNGSLKGVRNFDIQFNSNNGSYVGHSQITVNVRGFQHICLPWPFQNVCEDVHIASLETYNMPNYNGYGEVSRYKRTFDDDSKYVNNYNSRGNMDNVSGGYFDGFMKLAGPLDGFDPIFWQGGFYQYWQDHIFLNEISDFLGGAELTVNTNEQVHSFIPTISALGFINPDINWTQNFRRNLVCTGEIPFDNYYGPKLNEAHTSFTEASITWLLAEIEENPLPPSLYLEVEDLIGPNIVCSDNPVTFDFENCSRPFVDSWELSSNLQMVTSDNLSVTVEAVNNSNGNGFIQANYNGQTLRKNVWVGNPIQMPNILANTGSFPDSPVDFTFDLVNQVYTTQGSVVEKEWNIFPAYMVTSSNNEEIWIHTPSTPGIYLDYYLRFRNECGWSPQAERHGVTIGTGGGGGQNVTLYPNSSDDELYVDLTNANNNTYVLSLYDQFGVLLFTDETTNIVKTIDTHDLDEGLYVLHIYDGNELITKQVIIDH
ncbi:T9SS type A sorting domain-containing protein [Ulvibacter antarcticus]|nr:T9SS type A sorting domain-containing protein [Ulvibacter antarcticus]